MDEAFEQPTAAYRGKPFWSWNGELNKEELLRQLGLFKKMGMGGVFMHSRTGLKTEYLGKEWFELINACADECERLGLEAWLYDEDRWPSGTAGGMATEDPAFRMKALQLHVYEPGQVQWPKESGFVAAFVAELQGLNLGDYSELQYGADVAAGKGKVLVFEVLNTIEHSFYNGQTYLNTLDRKATEHFLQLTHEKYRQECGSRLGKSIKGIFTDEPHHGLVMCHNAEQRTETGAPDWSVPYTAGLFERFEKQWGYDLRKRLPDLFLWPQGSKVSQVKWHYMELLQQLFLENWAQPCLDWCRKHNLLLTGHVLHEDSLVAQAVPCGSVMRYYEYLDYPGVDLLCNNNRSYWVAKQLQSAGRQLGKKWLLSELYGCTGWQFDFASHKETGFWQALFGINLRCHHLSWVTMAGEAKRDYPASISFQSGWYEDYKFVEDYFSRMHVVLQAGEPLCDVLVINPVESVWAQIHPEWSQWLGAKDPEIRQLETRYEELFHWLSGAQIDFDYGDEEHLARLGGVERSGEDPVLRLGKCTYRTVVVGAMVTMRTSTLNLLKEFASAGGNVIFVGESPQNVDALPSSSAVELARQTSSIAFERTALIEAVASAARSPVRFKCDSTNVFVQVRKDGDRLFVVLINTDRHQAVEGIEISVQGESKVQEWNCETGERTRKLHRFHEGETLWDADLQPLGSRVFCVSALDRESLPEEQKFSPVASQTCEGPFEYTLSEPNICVLDTASYRLGDGEWQEKREILKLDNEVRQQLGMPQRSGSMLQPWAAIKQGLHKAFQGSALALCFEFAVEALPKSQVDLVMEMPERFSIRLNGKEVKAAGQLEWFVDPCMKRVPLPAGAFQHGRNTIELSTNFSPDTDLEAIFLVGDFGVSMSQAVPVLGTLPQRLFPVDVTSQGLPFYSGTIAYRLPLPDSLHITTNAERRWRLQVPQFGGALVKARLEGSDGTQVIAWPPNVAEFACATTPSALICEVVLTRINTFGPLHMLPKEQNGIAPDSFRTNGKEFSVLPQLWAAGLLEPPVITLGS